MVGGRETKVIKQELHLRALQSAESTKDLSVFFPFFKQTRQLSNTLTNKVIIVLIIVLIIMALAALGVTVS